MSKADGFATLSATIVGERVDAAKRRPGEVGRGTWRMRLPTERIPQSSPPYLTRLAALGTLSPAIRGGEGL
jgi:hypothetical protein